MIVRFFTAISRRETNESSTAAWPRRGIYIAGILNQRNKQPADNYKHENGNLFSRETYPCAEPMIRSRLLLNPNGYSVAGRFFKPEHKTSYFFIKRNLKTSNKKCSFYSLGDGKDACPLSQKKGLNELARFSLYHPEKINTPKERSNDRGPMLSNTP